MIRRSFDIMYLGALDRVNESASNWHVHRIAGQTGERSQGKRGRGRTLARTLRWIEEANRPTGGPREIEPG